MTEDHKAIHALYCSLTDRELPCTMAMHFSWNAWKAMGWGEPELRLVVYHIKGLIRLKRRYPESLRFYNLIQNTERFAEDLAEARALARRPTQDRGRAEALRATGRPDSAEPPAARQASDVLAGSKALAEFRKWKAENL